MGPPSPRDRDNQTRFWFNPVDVLKALLGMDRFPENDTDPAEAGPVAETDPPEPDEDDPR